MASEFIKPFSRLFKYSFQKSPTQTGRNSALGIVLTKAISDTYPNLAIDYSKVVVAKGSLDQVHNPAAVSIEVGKLRFNWTVDLSMGDTMDKAILVVYHAESGKLFFTLDGATRESGESVLDLPYFSGKQVHTWISFRSPEGQLIADSTYTGIVEVSNRLIKPGHSQSNTVHFPNRKQIS